MTDRDAVVIEADLELDAGVDTRAPGGAVTVALCGSWEHDGPCRWPHHSSIDVSAGPAHLRTVVSVTEAETSGVVERVEGALREDGRWAVRRCGLGTPQPDERALGARLAAGPHA